MGKIEQKTGRIKERFRRVATCQSLSMYAYGQGRKRYPTIKQKEKSCRLGEANRLGQMKISQFNCDKAMYGFAALLYGKACKYL